MKVVENEKKKFVKVIIGNCETGYAGIKKPTKSIRVEDSSVDEVHDLILRVLKKEQTKK